jgi:hypothetical protein
MVRIDIGMVDKSDWSSGFMVGTSFGYAAVPHVGCGSAALSNMTLPL